MKKPWPKEPPIGRVGRAVLQTAERERPCREAVLSRSRFACNDRVLEVGILFDVDVEAAFSSEDAGLASGASIVDELDS